MKKKISFLAQLSLSLILVCTSCGSNSSSNHGKHLVNADSPSFMNEMEGNFFEFSMDEMPNEIFNIYHEVLKTKIFSSTQYNCQVHALSSTIGQGMYYPSDYTAAQLLSEGNITHKDGYVIRYYDNMNEAKSSHLKRRTYYFEDTENSYSITLKCEPNHFDYIAGIVDESVKCID